VLEFGEPELIRQSALATYSLINAHLERQRKQVSLRQSSYDLVAEPIFLGLNVGGGLAGVPFAIGAAARLGYNTLIVPQLIPPVPSVKQLRDLLLLLAAREKHPEIKFKPERYLGKEDLVVLEETARHISDAELQEYMSRISDDDLYAMLELARLKNIDARVSNMLAIISGAVAISDLPLQHQKGKYYGNFPVRCEEREKYGTPANRCLV
jgi:SpoU rRNA methylase family enzyme